MSGLTNIDSDPGLVRFKSTRSEIITSEWRENIESRRRAASLNNAHTVPWPVDDMICSASDTSSQQVTSHPVYETAKDNGNSELVETRRRSAVVTTFLQWKTKAEPRTSWYLLLLCTVPINVLSGLEIFMFGFYYVEYVDYFEVASSVVGLIYTLRVAMFCLSSLVNSSILKRVPACRTVMFSGLIYMIAYILTGIAPNIYVLYITAGLLPGLASSLCFMTVNFLTQKLFTSNRAAAIGANAVGFSIGQIIAPSLLTLLIKIYGWRGSSLIVAALFLHITVLGWFCREPTASSTKSDNVNKRHPVRARRRRDISRKEVPSQKQARISEISVITVDDSAVEWTSTSTGRGDVALVVLKEKTAIMESNKDGRCKGALDTSVALPMEQTINVERVDSTKGKKIKSFFKDVFDFGLLRNKSFVMICLCSMINRYNINVYLQHMPRKAATLAISKEEVSFILSLYSIALTVGMILVTICTKWIDELFLYGSGMMLSGVASCLTLMHWVTALSFTAILQGTCAAVSFTVGILILINMVGINEYPKALSIFYVMISVGRMTAVPLSGYIYDVTHNYDTPFVLGGTLGVLAGLVILFSLLIKRCRQRTYLLKQDSVKRGVVAEVLSQQNKT